MAITRAQQFKQMLREGGRIGFQGGGADAATESFAVSAGGGGKKGGGVPSFCPFWRIISVSVWRKFTQTKRRESLRE